MTATACCAAMALHLDSLVIRVPTRGSFGLRHHGGSSAHTPIRYCPWCGVDLAERVTKGALGPPALKIAGFQLWVHGRQYPEAQDADDGNWLRISGHCGASGASVWIQGPVLMVTDLKRFGLECQQMFDGNTDRATLDSYEPELRVTLLRSDRHGHIRANVEMTPEHLSQTHHMRFEIDQTYLPAYAERCAAVVHSYPVRG